MAKQKIVVKVAMTDNKKRSKALKIAVGIFGVESAALQGADKDQIAVTGEGIDSVELTTLLRKSIGRTDLVSVGPVEEKKKEEAAAAVVVAASQSVGTTVPLHVHPYYYGTPTYPIYEVSQNDSGCSIM